MDGPLFFAIVTAIAVAIYVLADGFDLGVGILFLAAPSDGDRDRMMVSLEPVWDGNETWLVMGGTLLFAAFPVGYYVLLPALYLPVMLMLFALVFRGIAFGFRFQARRSRIVWDYAFAAGSALAAFAQGLVLGGFIDGIAVKNGIYAGGAFDFVNVLGILCGLGLVAGYALLGAGWLIWKTDGHAQEFARKAGFVALVVTAALMAMVSVWTALTQQVVAARWFAMPNIFYLAPVPVISALVTFAIWRSLRGAREPLAFVLSMVLFLLGFLGLAVSLWPYVVPRAVTIWQGAADRQSLWFAGVGVLAIMPVVIAYQLHAYWVFRGKVEHHPESY